MDGKKFNDVWEAIAANNPYAVKFVGDDVDDLEGDAQTDFPIMMADQMLDVAVIGNLYYGIIAVDVNQPLANFIRNDLGIDLQANLDNRDQLNPVLSVLKKGTLDRDDFTAVYIDSLCVLSRPNENQPDAAACAAAAQAVQN